MLLGLLDHIVMIFEGEIPRRRIEDLSNWVGGESLETQREEGGGIQSCRRVSVI